MHNVNQCFLFIVFVATLTFTFFVIKHYGMIFEKDFKGLAKVHIYKGVSLKWCDKLKIYYTKNI